MQAEETHRLMPLHRALHRPQQMRGDGRELVLLSMLIADGSTASAVNWPAMILGTCIWLICVYGLHRMMKTDPNVSKVYVRQLKCGDYYRPFLRPHRVAKSPRVYW